MRSCLRGVDRPCVLVLMVWLQGVEVGFNCDYYPCVAKHKNVEQ